MRIVARYDFNGGQSAVAIRYPRLLEEIEQAIRSVDATMCRTKKSEEKTMPGKMLYNPVALNRAFKDFLSPRHWSNCKVACQYSDEYYIDGYEPEMTKGAFRDMDFVKEKLGVEVQFGKYAFMVYNVCAKMTIFRNLGFIDTGIEIVPVKRFANEMSTGVSYFEQFVWDLSQRGVSDIDVPVFILGIDV